MKVATYYRVSTKGQGDDDRYGLPRQRNEVAAYIDRTGYEVVATFEDIGCSGSSADRPGLAALLEVEGVQAIVVPSWDRLARDTMLDGYLRFSLERRGIRVLSATQENGVDPIAKLTRDILAAVAGYERHLIAHRLAGSRKAKASRGGYAHGQAPYGTTSPGDGSLRINEAEIATLDFIRLLRREGLTIRSIATRLNTERRLSRTGKAWGPSSVHGALSSVDRVDALRGKLKNRALPERTI